jgi:alkylation response protein AidB-like acyl-CoA dehydrogenase
MDFGFNDEQKEIKRTAREFLADRFKPERVRELAESESPYDDALWKEMCELGWPGIAISEEYGGQGLGVLELVILCEEMGYACAPSPFLSNAIAGLMIEGAASDEQQQSLLPGIASGKERVAPALTPEQPSIVADADGASTLILPLENGEGVFVEPAAAEIEPLELIDATRSYARVSGTDGDPFTSPRPAHRPMVALAAELVGVAQRTLEMAVDYAKEREQFGRPIGAYQAVSHRCTDMLWATEEARSLSYYAAWCADADPESLPLAAHMAKARASDAANWVTNAALQVFGGIGFTWEHDLHFLLKRAKVSGQLLGTAREHRERVAELTGLGEPAAVPA